MEKLSKDRDIARLEMLARLLDSRFRIPFTDFRIGIDAIIGLFPFYGDAVGFIFSLLIVTYISCLGAPAALIVRLCLNSLFDFLVGLVPVLGDIADIYFKTNIKNVALARKYFESPRKVHRQSWIFLFLLAFILLLLITGALASVFWLSLLLYRYLANAYA